MKIRPVGAEILHVGERTDGLMDIHTDARRTDRHDEANSRSTQFCERA